MFAVAPASYLDNLYGAVDQAAQVELEVLSDRVLGEDISLMCREVDRLQAQITRRLAAFERRRGYAADACLSVVSWIRHNCRLSNWAATELLTVARQMAQLPQAEAAFGAGELSYENARIMARTSAAVGSEAYRQGEADLVAFVCRLSPHHFRLLNDRVRHLLDPGGALSDANLAYDRRWLRLSPVLDGMFALDGLLDAEGGACLQTALDSLLGPPARGEERSPGQRRADALVELARQALDAGSLPQRGGQRPHLTLIARQGEAGELDWAGLISAESVRRLSCDCTLSEIKIGPAGQVLDVGRARRTTPPSLRRAAIARDSGCRMPGCGRPWQWTDGHHLWHWEDGGPTSLENTVLLCRRHHRLVHEGGWKLSWGPNGELVALPP
jgi:uncharacterized small protein (DUF1192 family)